jgi:hypothetical protein
MPLTGRLFQEAVMPYRRLSRLLREFLPEILRFAFAVAGPDRLRGNCARVLRPLGAGAERV